MEDQLRQQFEGLFGQPPALIVRSPGRVNLIGEHTDYNDGWVFPAALDMGTVVAARRRDDRLLRVMALRMGSDDEASLDDLAPHSAEGWRRYVRGVAYLLQQQGHQLRGADLLIDSNLPLGSGLSSSASLELGVATALVSLAGLPLDRKALALLGQRTENEIIGVQSGIMDQFAVACGEAGHALLIDCRSLEVQPVPIPPDVRILVLYSAAPRELAGSAYNERRAQCESAVRKLQAVDPSIRALRDVSLELLEAEQGRLDPVELRRARHVVSENKRVLDGVAALRGGDAARLGQLMIDSHQSLRDDYEVSSDQLDTLVALALETPGVLGARLTGAGFGGCAVALAEAQHAEAAAATIRELYRGATGLPGESYVSALSAGVSVI